MRERKFARATGIAFITATIAGVLSLPFLSVTNAADAVQGIAAEPQKLIIGVALMMVMALACAGIALCIYPVLSRYNKGLAISAVGYRVLEAGMFLVSATSLIVLSTLAPQMVAQGGLMGNVLLTLHDALSVAAGFAFGLGALLYSVGFFKTKLVPGWLSIWGMVAAGLYLLGTALVLFGLDHFNPFVVGIYMPTALQEMVLAVWLIAKGFNLSEAKKQGGSDE